ncbi:MAG: type II toxin-antitoxin system VapC family toxin [Planctomycetota bacterium]|jgi:PIN domain nuclease of toxin-antitoxin system|nr:type II toxin-antitoxin system VapC family toxin [Planctomycetota bacterium]
MNYLLDTHALLWAIRDSQKLSAKARSIIADRQNKIFVSAVSFWEISKARLGRFSFGGVETKIFPRAAFDMDFSLIPLKSQIAADFYDLPLKDRHKDPFDRMLIWQAIVNRYTLISKDENFRSYQADGLQLVW